MAAGYGRGTIHRSRGTDSRGKRLGDFQLHAANVDSCCGRPWRIDHKGAAVRMVSGELTVAQVAEIYAGYDPAKVRKEIRSLAKWYKENIERGQQPELYTQYLAQAQAALDALKKVKQ